MWHGEATAVLPPLGVGDVDVIVEQRALELGNAPGGVSLNLLRRGLSVLGVDSQPMGPALQPFLDSGALTQLTRPMSQLRWEELTGRFDWLLMDVSIAPALALRGLRRLMPPLRKQLSGALLTLKLNDEAVIASVRGIGVAVMMS
jgi:23S rRNA C2498 (ribose-2'-O)-methylase RlmM